MDPPARKEATMAFLAFDRDSIDTCGCFNLHRSSRDGSKQLSHQRCDLRHLAHTLCSFDVAWISNIDTNLRLETMASATYRALNLSLPSDAVF